jgi:hypothetical protein
MFWQFPTGGAGMAHRENSPLSVSRTFVSAKQKAADVTQSEVDLDRVMSTLW